MTEAGMNTDHIRNATKSIFTSGTVEQRDALRSIANTVLAPNAMYACEVEAPDMETAYRLLDEIKFTGDGMQMLPADGVYALDAILTKAWREDLFSAVRNIALTMYTTDPATAGKGFWPRNHGEFNQLITRAFVWVLAQEGLKNLLKDPTVVSHTRLAQFMIATQLVGKDEPNLRHFTTYRPYQDTGGVNCDNILPESYLEQIRAERRAGLPAEYEAAKSMSFSDLADLCERLNVIGPGSVKPVTCKCDDDDCECEEDEYQTRDDFDEDQEELLDEFYRKFGFPQDEDDDEPEEEIWREGISLMEVEVDLPTVRLFNPETGLRKDSRMKKPAQKSRRNKILLTAEQQIWHKVDTDPLSVDRRFAISLVSRHTCGVSRPVATQREALAIAAALAELCK